MKKTEHIDLTNQIKELIELSILNKGLLTPAELKRSQDILVLSIQRGWSDKIKQLQVKELYRIIDDLANGAPILKTKVMGLALKKNKPKSFELGVKDPVPEGVVISARISSNEAMDKWRVGADDEISDENINLAILFCIQSLAELKVAK